jgi:hypothetical protein
LLRGQFPRGSHDATGSPDELVAYRLVFPPQHGGAASCFSAICGSSSDDAARQRLHSETATTFGAGLGGGSVELSPGSVVIVGSAADASCVVWARQDSLVLGLADGTLATARWVSTDGAEARFAPPRVSYMRDGSRLGKLWSHLRGRATNNPVKALVVLPSHKSSGV